MCRYKWIGTRIHNFFVILLLLYYYVLLRSIKTVNNQPTIEKCNNGDNKTMMTATMTTTKMTAATTKTATTFISNKATINHNVDIRQAVKGQ
jgi:hypothetical protein